MQGGGSRCRPGRVSVLNISEFVCACRRLPLCRLLFLLKHVQAGQNWCLGTGNIKIVHYLKFHSLSAEVGPGIEPLTSAAACCLVSVGKWRSHMNGEQSWSAVLLELPVPRSKEELITRSSTGLWNVVGPRGSNSGLTLFPSDCRDESFRHRVMNAEEEVTCFPKTPAAKTVFGCCLFFNK